MRWLRSSHGIPPASVTLLLFLSGLAALQQRTWAGSVQAADGDRPPQVAVDSEPRGPRQQPHYQPVKDANDASALATKALAGSGRAVRAPPVQVSPSAGLVTQLQQARSLRDWEVEDFVLLATIDGTIHARDRRTGAARWALEVPGSPTVESIYHRADRSSLQRQDSSSQSTVFSSSSSSSSYSFSFSSPSSSAISSSSSGSSEEASPDNDFLWIVEPSLDGSLYIYTPGPHGGIQKLGLTVKELVDQTPYSGTDPAVTYTARKETTLYTVDARTGEILRVFSSRGPITPQQSCRKVDHGDPDGQECESTGTLTVGRIEYAVAIQNTETGAPICTLKYSEWAVNSRDQDLQSQYYETMDQSHIYSMHDGVVLGFDHSRMERPRFTQRFSTPVIRVFDVARSIDRQSPEKATPMVLLAQPREPADPDYGSSERDERVFIDCTAAGGWYAMSESTYPLVTGRAKTALCYEKDFFRDGRSLLSLDLAHQREALAGVHSLSESPRGNGRVQPRPIPRLVDPSPPESSNDTPLNVPRSSSDFPSSPVPYNSVIIRKGWDNALDIFVTFVLLFIGTFIYLNSHHLQHMLRQKLDLQNIIAAYGGPGSLTAPSTPVVSEPPGKGIAKPFPETESSEQGQGPFQAPPEKVATVSITHSTEAPDGPDRDRESGDVTPRAQSTRRLTSETTLVPTVRIREPSQVRESGEENGEEPNPHEPEKKKKARRGRRGGVAHKRKQRPDSEGARQNRPSAGEKDLVPPGSSLAPSLEREFSLVRTASSDVLELDGAVRIGRLAVYTDTVLGHGSHGTVVYKGSFDGRDVAVKRMLVEFYDIASHEVGLLQESDDHSNVIRYFCREQAAGFLYIALELCPASLQDVVERPHDYPQLVHGGLDVPDVLRQITAGVRHLHSLKIVHRDVKPQNILVATPRGRSGHPTLRLLISDFGLCKKLEDNQSSFRATTAHAAGTSGWRAPELLVDDQNPNPVLITDSQNTESSEPAVVDPQTNRRATRAIDIFSLGCVFYYVLTRGGHPYDKDGKFMREANIVKGNYNLTDLERLGDYAFEADDLIQQMLSLNPRRRLVSSFLLPPFSPFAFYLWTSFQFLSGWLTCRHFRPDATTVLIHPFFWSAADRLNFLCDVSDHFEFEPRDPPSSALLHLESVARDVMKPDQDFLKHLPKEFKDSLGKQRKYNGSRMLDLLRALRNKRNHYNDMPEHLKTLIGGLPDGYLQFWAVRFPSLLMNCHRVIAELDLCQVERFKRYFTPPD